MLMQLQADTVCTAIMQLWHSYLTQCLVLTTTAFCVIVQSR